MVVGFEPAYRLDRFEARARVVSEAQDCFGDEGHFLRRTGGDSKAKRMSV